MDHVDGSARVIVYGHHGCGLARMLAEALAEHHLDHEWRDVVEGEPRFREELRRLARGYLSVPTVIFLDGTVMVEPSPREVLRKLSSHQPGLVERLLRR